MDNDEFTLVRVYDFIMIFLQSAESTHKCRLNYLIANIKHSLSEINDWFFIFRQSAHICFQIAYCSWLSKKQIWKPNLSDRILLIWNIWYISGSLCDCTLEGSLPFVCGKFFFMYFPLLGTFSSVISTCGQWWVYFGPCLWLSNDFPSKFWCLHRNILKFVMSVWKLGFMCIKY